MELETASPEARSPEPASEVPEHPPRGLRVVSGVFFSAGLASTAGMIVGLFASGPGARKRDLLEYRLRRVRADGEMVDAVLVFDLEKLEKAVGKPR